MEINKPFKFLTPSNWFTRRVNIDVIGVGGTGSEILASLARIDHAIRELGHSGLKIKAWDGDKVDRPNIGRQAFYPADLGHNKAIVTIQRINYLFGLDWVAVPAMFDVDHGTGNSDLVITCSWPIKLSQNWPTILSHFFLYLYLNICHSP